MTESAPRTGSADACGPGCGCGPTVSRRAFVAGASLTAASLVLTSGRAVAGPFVARDFDDFPIPADKKLDAAWVASLTARGEPEVWTSEKRELAFIGMPIGGIGCGQVYLGGDGRLWRWDVFNLPAGNEWRSTAGPHYATPAAAVSPIEQGFALRVTAGGKTVERRLDASGFGDVRFRGEYPIGRVEFREAGLGVEVSLEAFSPFIPLNTEESSLPVTVMGYTVKNTSGAELEIDIAGWLQNAVCLGSGPEGIGERHSRILNVTGWTGLECRAREVEPPAPDPEARPDVLFEDFERPAYDGWSVTGTAFGDGPVEVSKRPAYMGELNAEGRRAVNTHNVERGEDSARADRHIGTLTSREFTIERNFISLRIGGGEHPGRECVNILVDGAPVRSVTGKNSNRMRIENIDVREFAGRRARVQVVDGATGGWGQVGVDEIVFCDRPRREPYVLEAQADYGSMVLALVGEPAEIASASIDGRALPGSALAKDGKLEAAAGLADSLIGAVGRSARLAPGASETFTFILAWHFSGLWWESLSFIPDVRNLRRHYAVKFRGAAEVAAYTAEHLERLRAQTRLWTITWYDSTLPYWFLDRTMCNTSTLATATCYRFSDGRFYGWEGTYCCAGTCTHVWQYAHAVARLFPALERSTREMIDFGKEFNDETGTIHYRGEVARELAIDGQCGTILRAYREHQMSPDAAFLKKVWPRVKRALEAVIARDEQADGILDGAQYNTLDATWWGQIAWMSSLYLAAARAGEAMAQEMGDGEFAQKCAGIAERGSAAMVERLYNGEYFIQVNDPAHPEANSTGPGCHIDQLLGQSWAYQVGLGRIVPAEQSVSAMRSLYRYNFTPDIGPYRTWAEKTIKGGRWYAMPGEGGLVMCTFPKGGIDTATGRGQEAWAASYFNECMSGFEHQAAAHMIREGLVQEGLAVTRMIHDRYHPSKRNPYNEVECSDHYARAMASFGTYLSALGYEHHGPNRHLAFAPRLSPERFRAAFTACECWGLFEQERAGQSQNNRVYPRYGRLRLRTLGLEIEPGWTPRGAAVRQGVAGVGGSGRHVPARFNRAGERVTLTFPGDFTLNAGELLIVEIR
ncbi:MAG: hypothetical protein IT436_06275 [Phycisphaerales bacterium]|nr:hypothetical protein [Phycisphaerales bacterium]